MQIVHLVLLNSFQGIKELRRKYSKNESIAGKFTAAGFACFNYGVEDPQRFIDYVTKF